MTRAAPRSYVVCGVFVLALPFFAGATLAGCRADTSGTAENEGDGDEGDIEAPPPLAADFQAELQGVLEANLAAAVAPGLAAAVEIPGFAPWLGTAGVARKQPPTPVAPTDRFRIGSVTKMYTSPVVLQLVEEGKLRLDDPVARRWPAWNLDARITVEMLLRQLSGVYNFTDDPGFLRLSKTAATPEQVVEFALSHPPTNEPGEAYHYSNTNYYLLGLIIEAETGKPLEQNFRERLFEPLGLRDTFLEAKEEIPGGLIDGHISQGKVENNYHASWAWATGGLVSRANDMCRYARGLLTTDTILPPARLAQLLTPTQLPGRPAERRGMEVELVTRGGREVAGHIGATMGFRAEVFFDRELGVCVALTGNDFLTELDAVTEPLFDLVRRRLGAPVNAGATAPRP